MAPPKDIARSYPKRGLTADVGFRSEPKFCGDGSTEFDGTSDFATATNYAGGNAGGTFCFWFKTEDKAASQVIFSNANVIPKDAKAQVWILSSTIKFSDTVDAIEIPSTGFEVNTWHFACMVLNSTDGIERAYFDGVEHSTIISFGSGPTTTSLAIGSRNHVGANFFNGNLAKFKIFNVALTKDQVLELYNNPGLDVPTGLTSSNLRRNYELETDFNDSGADSENATASGSPSFTVDRPQLPRGLDLARGASMARVYTGRAVDFDGSADKIIAAHYNPSGDFLTTTAWVNADTLRGQGLIYNGSTGRNSFLFYMLSTGVLNFYWNDTTGDARITHQTPLKNGQWYHLAAVMDMSDPADHQVTFYIDGIAATGTRTASGFTGDNNYGIGLEYGSTGWFDGKIADCRIFDVELTQAQIRELYHNPEQVLPTGVSASNLRRYYPLSDYNDTGGTGGRYFQDMGADGEPAVDQGSALMAFAQPVPCPQLGLQQSATRVYFENNATRADATLGAAPGTACTMSAWLMVEDTSNYQYIFTQGTTFGSTAWFGIAKNYNNNKLYALQNSAIKAESSLQLSDYGEWNHVVAMTKSTAPYIRWFINGVEDTSINDLGMVAYNLTSTNVSIGSNPAYPNNMQGFANDCAIWDVELSDPEVAALYNSGVQGMDVSTVQSSNLKGWWKCDDLTSFKDYSGNGVNATLTGSVNAASFPENASGSTIVGDFTLKRRGVSVLNKTEDDNDVLAIIPASADVFPTSQGFTCSVWVRGRKTTGNAYIVATTNRTTSQRYSIYTQSASNNWGLEMPVSSGTTGADAAITYDPNEWACLSFTLDFGTNTVKMYTNGALQTTVTRTLAVPTTFSDINVGGSGAAHGSITGTTPVALFKVAQRTWSDDEVQRNYYSDLRLIKGLENE